MPKPSNYPGSPKHPSVEPLSSCPVIPPCKTNSDLSAAVWKIVQFRTGNTDPDDLSMCCRMVLSVATDKAYHKFADIPDSDVPAAVSQINRLLTDTSEAPDFVAEIVQRSA